ncbi:MAG: signal peptidase II [Gemmatimonadota bacterium]
MTEHRHLTSLARIALLVTVGDLVTKAAAKALLSNDATWFASWLHFAVVHNDKGAFGWSAGVYTWQLNFALTLAAIVFMIPVTRDLARIDPLAPRALGLIVGGALGNLASLVTSPIGVVDFIQVDLEHYGLALNVADVAAYTGLAMILRTGALLVVALRREARLREPRRVTPVRSVFAEKAELTMALRPEPLAADAARDAEVTVLDFNRVVPRDRSRPRDDESRVVEPEILTVRSAVVRSGIVGDISPMRSMGSVREVERVRSNRMSQDAEQ